MTSKHGGKGGGVRGRGEKKHARADGVYLPDEKTRFEREPQDGSKQNLGVPGIVEGVMAAEQLEGDDTVRPYVHRCTRGG